MATSSFDSKVIINNNSAKRLLNSYNNSLNYKKIDVQREIKESVKSLRRVLMEE